MQRIKRIHYEICDSTNLRAREYLKQNKPQYLLVSANAQTAGRGRQGKSFFSPADTGAYMTFAFRAQRTAASLVTLTTAAATYVCRALEKLSDKDLGIKWVNDIYLDNKKICGILCETIVTPISNMVEYVIVGVGVNINTQSFPDDISDIAGNLGSANADAVISEITGMLLKMTEHLDDRSYMDYYREKSVVIGRKITCITADGNKNAVACEVDDDGGLIVSYDDGSKGILRSGEISLRLR